MRKFTDFSISLISFPLITSFATQVHAKEITTLEDYRLYCGRAAYQYNVQSPDCDRLRGIFENKLEQNESEKQYRYQLRRRSIERTDNKKDRQDEVSGYLGTTIIGLFFPDSDDLNTGFGGSFFGGVKFNRYIGLDLELGLFLGGTENEDAYGVWSAFINPRFFIPLSPDNKHLAVYISPGIGVSQLIEGGDPDDARLTWQVKGGIAVPIYKRLGGYGEVRYADQFTDEDFGSGAFGTEAGLTLRL